MKIGEYLIKAIQETGTRHVFGIQGDYVLGFYEQLCKSPLKVINTCTEQGAGFAADAYARIRGFGVVCVTYGVGGLSIANSTAQAFAERSPVLVISGSPGVSERRDNPLLHHRISSFQAQLNVFREMTIAQATLEDAPTAAAEIDRVINAIKETKRPGYIELPRDMVQTETQEPPPHSVERLSVDQTAIDEACREVLAMVTAARRPIVLAGVEVHRFGLQQLLLKFLERSGLPFVSGILGKSVVSEKHPQFVGIYEGAASPDDIREAVEGADCIIAVGPLITDLSTGIFTQHIDPQRVILLEPGGVTIKQCSYLGIGMKPFLESLTAALPEGLNVNPPKKNELTPFVPEANTRITIERLIGCVNTFLSDDMAIIADVGEALLSALDLSVHEANEFLASGYYASLGFAVPAALGVQLAAPERRPLIIAGDGSFQMSAMELSVAVRYGLSPIVIVLNNGGYGTFRSMMNGAFNDIQPWKYADIGKIIGAGEGYTVSKEEELPLALMAAEKNNSYPTIIDVRLDKYDSSARMKRLTENLKKRVR